MKILITGSSKGIGNYLAERFIESGNVVYGTFNNTKPKPFDDFHINKVNVENESEVNDWIRSLPIKINDKIVLINCAGINYNAFTHKSDAAKWRRVININLLGSYYCIKEILPTMRENGFGRIINISSVVPQIGVLGTSAYSASKAAIWGLTKTVAIENVKKGITCNVINLGYFDIGMIQDIPNEFKEVIISKIPAGNFGHPIDIYRTILYLIETDYITGTSINLNGGLF